MRDLPGDGPPIRGRYSCHMITLDQSEASVQVSRRLVDVLLSRVIEAGVVIIILIMMMLMIVIIVMMMMIMMVIISYC